LIGTVLENSQISRKGDTVNIWLVMLLAGALTFGCGFSFIYCSVGFEISAAVKGGFEICTACGVIGHHSHRRLFHAE